MANFSLTPVMNIVDPDLLYDRSVNSTYGIIAKPFSGLGETYGGLVGNATGQYSQVVKNFNNYSIQTFTPGRLRPSSGQLFPI